MNRFFLLVLMSVFAVSFANAQTKLEVNLAGDLYYATDNDEGRGLHPRPLQSSNIYKDRFGTNNVLLRSKVTNNDWKANFSVATFGQGSSIAIEDANIGLRITDYLWFTGGLFAVWDVDYTFDRWFTGNSLTDSRNMAGPYMACGVEIPISNNFTFATGLMNSNALSYFEMPNLTKSFYMKVDSKNLYEDWDMTFGCIAGNTASYRATHNNTTEIYISAGGTLAKDLEAKISGKFFKDALDKEKSDPENTATLQALVNYRLNKKYSVGARLSFITGDEGNSKGTGIDFGLVWQYNPVPYTYFRIEGGMISLSNSDNDNYAKIFSNGEKASRLGIALSMGFKFGLFETEIK